MTAKRISEDGGLQQVLRGELGSLNEATAGIDVDADVQRMFEFSALGYRIVDAAAGTDYDHALIQTRKKARIKRVMFIPHDALAAPGATSYSTISLSDGTTTYASLAVTTALTANTPRELTLGSDLTVDAETTLRFLSTKSNATGSAIPAGFVQVDMQHD